MTRNGKIALGCGAAGCLGLIVVVVAGGLIYFFTYRRASDRYGNDNYNRIYNVNSSRTANRNGNDNDNADDLNSNSNDNSSSSSSSASEMSEDDKHKLFQAAAITGDTQLQRRVWVKIGIMNEDFTEGEKFSEFAAEHVWWAIRNYQWMNSMNSAEKGRAYVNEHLD